MINQKYFFLYLSILLYPNLFLSYFYITKLHILRFKRFYISRHIFICLDDYDLTYL
nr:MAG TPA: hypothetical protein [Caudoviricetes sp.]